MDTREEGVISDVPAQVYRSVLVIAAAHAGERTYRSL
ncbi:hypothetical protein J2129_000546 [Methanofollis sp. W23]|nr:hypothetical protein [Methanofollis sp. W23]